MTLGEGQTYTQICMVSGRLYHQNRYSFSIYYMLNQVLNNIIAIIITMPPANENYFRKSYWDPF